MNNLLDPSEQSEFQNFTYTMNCNANDADINQSSSVNGSTCHDDVAIPYEVNTKQISSNQGLFRAPNKLILFYSVG